MMIEVIELLVESVESREARSRLNRFLESFEHATATQLSLATSMVNIQ